MGVMGSRASFRSVTRGRDHQSIPPPLAASAPRLAKSTMTSVSSMVQSQSLTTPEASQPTPATMPVTIRSNLPAMGLLRPTPTPYDPLEWMTRPFLERAQLVCRAWALEGYG